MTVIKDNQIHLINSYISGSTTGLGLIASAGVNFCFASRIAKLPPAAEYDACEAPDVLTCVPLFDATTVAAVRRIHENRVIIDRELRNKLAIDNFQKEKSI